MTELFPAPAPIATEPTPTRHRRWPWIVGMVAMFIVGSGVGVVMHKDPLGNRTAAVAQREEAATALEQSLADQEQTGTAALDAREAKLDERQETLDQISAALDDESKKLDSREQALLPREQEAAKNTIKGDGIFLVGKDVNPGTYRNSGTSSCYWQRSSGTSGDFDDILANGNESGPAVVTIAASDIAFTSKRCGSWTLVN